MTDLLQNPERLVGMIGVITLLLTFIGLLLRGIVMPRSYVPREQLERALASGERQADIIGALTSSVERLSKAVDRCNCHQQGRSRT